MISMAVTPETQQAFLTAIKAGNTAEAVTIVTPLEKVLAAPTKPEIYYPAFGGNADLFRNKLKQDLEPVGDEIVERADGGTELRQKITVLGLNYDATNPDSFSEDDLADIDFEMTIQFGSNNLPEEVRISQKKHHNFP